MRWGAREYNVWNRWFAWRPIRVGNNEGVRAWVWLEPVERSWTFVNGLPFGSQWYYRLPQ